MIQIVAILLIWLAAVGIWLADGFTLLIACWGVSSVAHAGLVAALGTPRVREIAREVFLGEMLGGWVLLMSALNLVLAADVVHVGQVAAQTPRPVDLLWSGLGLLTACAARLGLPPFAPWPVRLAATPPAVRVFLHAAVQPAMALLLWWRFDAWLLPWHRDVALWLGAGVALVASMAAMGERLPPRRAALLTTGAWAGLLGLGAHGTTAPLITVGSLAVGTMALHLAAASPRWPRAWRRGLLGLAAAGLVATGLVTVLSGATAGRPSDAARVLVLATYALQLVVVAHALVTTAPSAAAAESPRAMLASWLTPLARRARDAGPVPWLAATVSRRLADGVVILDRVILDRVVEGLALIGLGAGWWIAWCDRRGLDLAERGVGGVTVGLGRWMRRVVAASAGLLTIVAVLVLLVVVMVTAHRG